MMAVKVKQQYPKSKLTTVTVSFVVEARRKLTRKDAKVIAEWFRSSDDDSVSRALIGAVQDCFWDTGLGILFVHTEPADDEAPNTLTVEVK